MVSLIPVLRPEVLAPAGDCLANDARLAAQLGPCPVRGRRRVETQPSGAPDELCLPGPQARLVQTANDLGERQLSGENSRSVR